MHWLSRAYAIGNRLNGGLWSGGLWFYADASFSLPAARHYVQEGNPLGTANCLPNSS